MITDKELQELVEFHSNNMPVLSVYLNVDPTQRTKEEYTLQLRGLLKEAEEAGAAKADITAVERYFDFEYDWQGKGVIIFSCQDENFWRAYSLAVPVDNHVYVAPRPYLKPLTDVLDAYGRYGVVLVDREGARLFMFHMGELQEATGILRDLPKRHKAGGWAAQRHQRRADEHALRNLREVAELMARFFERTQCTRIVLGGTEDNVAKFQEMLPKALQNKVIGTFSVGPDASVAEIQERSRALIEELAQQREARLVQELIAGWRRDRGSAVGLSDTLAAFLEQRAGTLLVSAGYTAPGYRCRACAYLTLQEREECPWCGGEIEPVEDIVDELVHRALEQGVEVEIVRGNEDLEKAGRIGALLRY